MTEEVECREKERGRHFRGTLRKGDRENERRERKGKGGGRDVQTRKEMGNDNAVKEIICPKF